MLDRVVVEADLYFNLGTTHMLYQPTDNCWAWFKMKELQQSGAEHSSGMLVLIRVGVQAPPGPLHWTLAIDSNQWQSSRLLFSNSPRVM